MNLHDSRDKRAVVLQKVVIQKLHGLHQGNRIRSRSSFFIKNCFFHKKVVCIELDSIFGREGGREYVAAIRQKVGAGKIIISEKIKF